jgi:hypothetical protein
MTLFRKSLTTELGGRAQRLAGAVTHDRARELRGVARQYAGQAGLIATRAGTQVRKHPRTSIAVGAGIGVAALAAAWLIHRHQQHQLALMEHDEHDPTRYRPTNASGDALDGSGEDNPVPGETGLY